MVLKEELSKKSNESKFVLIILAGLILYLINTHKGSLFGTENKILLSIILFVITIIVWFYFIQEKMTKLDFWINKHRKYLEELKVIMTLKK